MSESVFHRLLADLRKYFKDDDIFCKLNEETADCIVDRCEALEGKEKFSYPDFFREVVVRIAKEVQ